MIYVLGEVEDEDVLWAVAALRRRGASAEVVLNRELLTGTALSLRVDDRGTSADIRADFGCSLQGASLILNRLPEPYADSGHGDPKNAAYVAEEWRAVLAACLRALPCPVLNPPRAASLLGPTLPTPAWRSLANSCGLRAAAWCSDSVDPEETMAVVTLGSWCVSHSTEVPERVRASLALMARRSGVPLLGATFARQEGDWVFLDATPRPAMRPFGMGLVDALLRFTRRESVSA